ncbi:MAG: DUF2855 family protein [Acidimicrobiia bacterium]|nr:DUF2855 family protein [Acidimicrobiia bacterium]
MDVEVVRRDLATARLVPGRPLPDEPPAGTALARIESFALTANNVTYAVTGDLLGYWRFFPAADERYGRVPVWGHAEIVASSCPGVEVGGRCYGFWPTSSHLLLAPVDIGPGGFVDGTAHRADLPDVYNRYERAADRNDVDPDGEARAALWRPLFTTSFLLDDWIGSAADGDTGDPIVISCASSKTALGLAHLLRAHGRGEVVGLTSAGHVEFCGRTGVYDRVVAYDELPEGLGAGPATYVDIAGNPTVTAAVHRHLGDRLRRSVRVGFTHHDAPPPSGSGNSRPGPAPEMFFAPDHVRRRLADWGGPGFAERLAAARNGFESGPAAAITLERINGADGVLSTWRQLVAGTADPRLGFVCSF